MSILPVLFLLGNPCLRLQDQYTAEFTKFKPDKKLRWLTHLGTVDVELELEDRVVDALVSPLEAAVIELFSERSMAIPVFIFARA